jgi:hypothetical protein
MSEDPEISGPYRTLLDFIEKRGYVHSSQPAERKILINITGRNAEYRFQLRLSHDDEFLQILVHYPFRVREEKLRGSVAELLTRANYAMLLGKFEMDLSDGEVRFHLSHLIESELSVETVERLFFTSLLTAERYFPALMQHLHAGYTPEDAVYLAELDYHSDRVADGGKPIPKGNGKPGTSPKKPSSSRKSSAFVPKQPAKPVTPEEMAPSPQAEQPEQTGAAPKNPEKPVPPKPSRKAAKKKSTTDGGEQPELPL